MERKPTLAFGFVMLNVLGAAGEARADDATIVVGVPSSAPPPAPTSQPALVATDRRGPSPDEDLPAQTPELPRSSFRLLLGTVGVTTGKGFGLGVGVGADFGRGSVGARLFAASLRGEGKTDGGASTPTGDSIGHYTAEITIDLRKRGPVHPVIGLGVGVLHVSRPDRKSGFGGMGTGRLALEYALPLDDEDVRLGASVTGGVLGPIDSDVKDLRAYALTGLHVAVGF